MAIFEPTEEEKAASTYLEWDDAELGKFAKYCALELQKNSRDAEGLHRVAAASAAMLLVGACVDANAADLELKIGGHTRHGRPTGDWLVTVKRRPSPGAADE